MIILFRNSTDFWVPSYIFNDDSYIALWNLPYFLLISVGMFTCSWLTFYMTVVMCEVRKFHTNTTYLLVCLYASWFENLVGTLLILPYKYGLINLAPQGRVFEGFEDTENYLEIDEVTWKAVPLIIGTLLVWHYLGMINSAFGYFFVERTLATVFFSDYESVPRKPLLVLLVFLQQSSALFTALMMCFHVFPLKMLLAFNATGIVSSVPYLIFLRYYNIRARNRMRLARNITKNTLAAKFQTEENVRSISLASRIITVMIFFDVVFLIITVSATLEVPGTRYYFQGTEHLLFFGPLFLVPAVLSCVEDWRKKFFVYIPINKMRINPESINLYTLSSNRHEEHTDIHFMQLQSLWV